MLYSIQYNKERRKNQEKQENRSSAKILGLSDMTGTTAKGLAGDLR